MQAAAESLASLQAVLFNTRHVPSGRATGPSGFARSVAKINRNPNSTIRALAFSRLQSPVKTIPRKVVVSLRLRKIRAQRASTKPWVLFIDRISTLYLVSLLTGVCAWRIGRQTIWHALQTRWQLS